MDSANALMSVSGGKSRHSSLTPSTAAGQADAAAVSGDFLQSLSDAVRSLGTRSGAFSSAASSSSSGQVTSIRSASTITRGGSGTSSSFGKTDSAFDVRSASGAGERRSILPNTRSADAAGGQSSYGCNNSAMSAGNAAQGANQATGVNAGETSTVTDETENTDDTAETAEDSDQNAADIAAALAMLPFDPTLTSTGLEALNRIATLVGGGALDPDVLSGLSDGEAADLADWALEGAGGLLPAFEATGMPTELDLAPGASAETGTLFTADFGLMRAAQAVTQMQTLQQSLALGAEASTADGSAGALAGVLEDLNGTGTLSQDALSRMASSLQGSLTAAAEQSGVTVNSNADLVQAVPGAELESLLNQALVQEGAQPVENTLPEAVVRSLGVTILSSSADEAAAGPNLMDDLNSNQGLRQSLLAQMGAGEEIAAPSADAGSSNLAQMPLANAAGAASPVVPSLVGADTAATSGADVAGVLPAAQQQAETVVAPVAQATTDETTATVLSDAVAGPVVRDGDAETGSFGGQSQEQGQEHAGGDQPSLREQAALLQGTKPQDAAGLNDDGFALPTSTAVAGDDSPFASTDDGYDLRTGGIGGASGSSNTSATGAASQTGASSSVRYSQMTENIERLQKLLQGASSGSSLKSLTMLMNPEELGKITVTVELRDGTVHATIKTENDAARDMLLSGGDQLRKTMESSGIKLDTFDVSVNREGYDESNGRNQAGWQAAQEEQEKRLRNGGGGGTGSGDGTVEEEIVDESVDVLPGGSLNVVA